MADPVCGVLRALVAAVERANPEPPAPSAAEMAVTDTPFVAPWRTDPHTQQPQLVRCVRIKEARTLVYVWRCAGVRKGARVKATTASRARRLAESRLAPYLRSLISNAVRHGRGIAVRLSAADLYAMWQRQRGLCALSGVPMSHTQSLAITDRAERNASLDRIDSARAYTPDNVQLVCACVNRMKWDMPEQHFVWWCRTVARRAQGRRLRRADRDRFAAARAEELDIAQFV